MPGGVAEWLKAAVLKTAERKLRGFESLLLRNSRESADNRIVCHASGRWPSAPAMRWRLKFGKASATGEMAEWLKAPVC